jgi:septal ring factor EnvC (AmiA/AmiB activator)
MYKCEECGGFIEELGEMVLSGGGCICAQKKAEESANNLQQLKAEIHGLADKWRSSNMTTAQLVIELDRLSGELSAV